MKRIEWRHNGGYDSILVIEDNRMITGCQATDELLVEIMGKDDLPHDLDNWSLSEWSSDNPDDPQDPEAYGELVLALDSDGEQRAGDSALLDSRLEFYGLQINCL